ncbi:MAG TPA: universal stress protein [Solirubrobacteraceae bacterium]|jgi:nucleotide-binding universal stress UspA family protein
MQVLICYDGSPDAEAALAAAGALFAGNPATILTIWEGFSEVMTRAGAGLAGAPLDFEEIDRASAAAARERSEEGCAVARLAGLDAHARTAQQSLTVWGTILEQADKVGADVIVLGSRGLTGVKSLLLGSVSHAVLQHADRPVIVVPGAEVARKRADRRHERRSGLAEPDPEP